MMEQLLHEKYQNITKQLIEKQLTITTMESCTTGLIASLLTDTEGSSAILKGAYITYSNEAKIKNGVPKEIIEQYGVYSKETAIAMAKACRAGYQADMGIGITGTFGNVDPNNEDSEPGRIYFAIACGEKADACVAVQNIACDRIHVFEKELQPQPSRYEYKLAAARELEAELCKIIQEK